MSTIKKTISIDKNLVKEINMLHSNFSSIVEKALIEYLHSHRLTKAIQSFGKWKEREESSVDIVNNLRARDNREFKEE